jgi:hypothetical protein
MVTVSVAECPSPSLTVMVVPGPPLVGVTLVTVNRPSAPASLNGPAATVAIAVLLLTAVKVPVKPTSDAVKMAVFTEQGSPCAFTETVLGVSTIVAETGVAVATGVAVGSGVAVGMGVATGLEVGTGPEVGIVLGPAEGLALARAVAAGVGVVAATVAGPPAPLQPLAAIGIAISARRDKYRSVSSIRKTTFLG